VRAELLELTRLGGLELREEVRVERRASASEQAWGAGLLARIAD
jgi:hypothetical protein